MNNTNSSVALSATNPLLPFTYEGKQVSFIKSDDGSVLINATEMAKAFGKRPSDWLKLPNTKEFLNELSSVRKSPTSEYQAVITAMGSAENGGGTWLHEDAAIEFARWLSPKFAIWCNDHIKQILKEGISMTPQTAEDILSNPDFLIKMARNIKKLHTRVEELEIEKQRIVDSNKDTQQQLLEMTKFSYDLSEENTQLMEEKKQLKRDLRLKEEEIEMYKDASDYLNLCKASQDLLTTTQIAQDYGMSAKAFNQLLKDWGIQYKQNGQWILYAPLKGLGYVSSKTIEVKKSNKVVMSTHWTQTGRIFLYRLMKKHDIIPLIETQR